MAKAITNRQSLVDDLVERGLVPEENRQKLSRYLACRDEFLDMFGPTTRVEKSLRGLVKDARRLNQTARDAAEHLDRQKALLETKVLDLLQVLLEDDEPAFRQLQRDIRDLEQLPAIQFEPGALVRPAENAMEQLTRIDELLVKVREELKPWR